MTRPRACRVGTYCLLGARARAVREYGWDRIAGRQRQWRNHRRMSISASRRISCNSPSAKRALLR